MAGNLELIQSLSAKVDTLLAKMSEEKSELAQKVAQINSLQNELEGLQSQVSELKGENESLKNQTSNPTDNSEQVKDKIDGLVREIEECISLLKV